ncbi:MAG TPA: hypothetical protein VMZ53_26410 [Kofleriaceae bacterium]|nr:hypothetical protein [Kofleriaceae bacterium]
MHVRLATILLASVAFVPLAAADDPFAQRDEGQAPQQPTSPAPPQAIPDPPKKPPTKQAKADAKKHITEGTKLYNTQQYAQAAEHYRAAYMLDSQPEYLYAAAQSQRLAGDCTNALLSYNAYLRTNPKDAERDKAQKNIERCEQDLKDKDAAAQAEAARKAQEEAAAKQAADAAAAKAAADAADAKRRADEAAANRAAEEAKAAAARHEAAKKSYVPGHIMLGVGLVAVGGGIFLFRDAHSTIEDFNATASYDEFLAGQSAADDAHTRQTLGVLTISGGVALVAGAAVFYVLHSRSSTEVPAVSASITHDSAGLVFSGAF